METVLIRKIVPTIMMVLAIHIAHADGLTALQLQQLMATGVNSSNVSVARIGAANGVASLDGLQRLTNPLVGNASSAAVVGNALGMTGVNLLATLLSDNPSIRLFAGATTTGRIGGAVVVTTVIDNPAGSSMIILPPTPYAATSKFVTLSVQGDPSFYTGYTTSINAATTTINLPSGITLAADIPSGTPVGVVQQDDLPAFQAAAYSMQSVNGGVGGNLLVPAGSFWLSGTAYTGDAVTIISPSGVIMAPGSGRFDTWMPAVGGEGLANFEVAAQLDKGAANAFTIVTTTPGPATGQQDAEIIIQSANNQNAGLVGEEIQQHVGKSFSGTGPQMFGYHLLDFIYPGQKPYFAAAEFEINDTSGHDQSSYDQTDSKYMIHLDSLGNTPQTAGINFDSRPGAGFHYGMACNGAILNWCIATFMGGGALSNVTGGMRPDGSMLATSLVVNGSTRLAASIISSQQSSYTIAASDCGTTIRNSSSAAVVYTIPVGLSTGCKVDVLQAGAGPITFTGGTGETIEAYGAANKTSGQYATGQVLIDTPATFRLSGQVQ